MTPAGVTLDSPPDINGKVIDVARTCFCTRKFWPVGGVLTSIPFAYRWADEEAEWMGHNNLGYRYYDQPGGQEVAGSDDLSFKPVYHKGSADNSTWPCPCCPPPTFSCQTVNGIPDPIRLVVTPLGAGNPFPALERLVPKTSLPNQPNHWQAFWNSDPIDLDHWLRSISLDCNFLGLTFLADALAPPPIVVQGVTAVSRTNNFSANIAVRYVIRVTYTNPTTHTADFNFDLHRD